MIMKTLVPKIGDPIYYMGKPVTNGAGARIGSVTEVNEIDDHYELVMDVPGVYSKPDRDSYTDSFHTWKE